MLLGQPLHLLKHALQIFTDASKKGWGAHLDEHTARGTWSLPESKLHINHLELKAVFLALKEFRTLCPCNRIILIAPGWPNMPWFWDLVAISSHIPLCLPNIPNLVSQPFNQVLHRNLSNLNLHAWLLEPQQSRSKASLRQWQHELRLLKEDQPDLSMRQSGPFLQSGASVIRWTSGHHL